MSNEFDKNGIPSLRTAFEKAGALPEGWTSDYFINAHQEKIFYAKIPAKTGAGETPRGSVVLTTGYNDSIFNNTDTIREWQKRGFDVYAMDWASQGASQRNPLHPDRPSSRSLDYHVRDLDQFVRHIVEPQAEKPLILSTHSMGGAIGALYMQKYPDMFTKAVLGAPMLDLDTSILPRSWFKTIANVANNTGLKNTSLPNWREALYNIKNFNPFAKHDDKPQDLNKVFATASDGFKPYELAVPTWGWVKSAYSSMDKLNQKDFYKGIKTEILFVSAGHDELVDNKAVKSASHRAEKGRLLNLSEAQHGVWNSSSADKAQLWNEIDNMIDGLAPRIQTAQKSAPKIASLQTDFSPAFA